jgi:RNA polymerase sigma-70 factor (ECF subfamily)
MGDSPAPSDHTLQVQRLFVQHQQVVLYYVLTIVPDLADAQDIVQETFLTITRKADTYTLGTNFPAWACTTARYQALQFQRTRARAAARLDDDVLEMLYSEDAPLHDSLEPRTDALKNCLDRLTPKALELIRLRYHLGQLPEDIATTVGWTPNSVRVALTRARQILRVCVERTLHTA